MTSDDTIQQEVNEAFKKASAAPLSSKADATWKEIVSMTVIPFSEAVADLDNPEDVWQNAIFKRFILGAVVDIAKEASDATKEGDTISADTLSTAATKVMLKKHKKCHTAIENGRVIFPGFKQGMVCSGYLNTKLKADVE